MARFTILLICILICLQTVAAEKQKSSQIKAHAVRVVYGSAPWNLDSGKIDSAFLFFRNGSDGKLAKIALEETAPDSSIFSGTFSIGWVKAKTVKPEIFIPPQNMRSAKSMTEFSSLIGKGKVARKPIVFRKDFDKNVSRILDVYDTKKQAKQAYKAYKKELKSQKKLKKKSLLKPVASKSDIDTAMQADKSTAIEKLKIDAAKRETDRIRMEQLERQRAKNRVKEANKLSAAQRLKRQKKAAEIAENALDFFRLGVFAKAEEFFKQSVDLDPLNKSYYYKYAISLYRNEKYNEAMVIIKLAEVEDSEETEREYYMGLIHYRLKELDFAIVKFDNVRKSKNVGLAPSAAFYNGLIYYSREELNPAEQSFQEVLDTSQDPRLDKQAEDYIEKILAMKHFKKQQATKFRADLSAGISFDSNILLAGDTEFSQGSAFGEDGTRLQLLGGVEYQPIYQREHELKARYDIYYLYSLNQDDYGIADPFLNTITIPYAYKSKLFGKGFKLTLTPGYESLLMDPNDTGSREAILNSIIFKISTLFIMNKTWYANYTLDTRSDDSKLASSVGPENSDASKISLTTSQTVFREDSKKTAIIVNAGFVLNSAKGDNKAYQRIELGATYLGNTKWDTSYTVGISAYQLAYPNHSDSRKDTNLTFSSAYTHPVSEKFSWGLTGSFVNNGSNVDQNKYDQYSVGSFAKFIWD